MGYVPMTEFLLDTSVLSETSKKRPNPTVVEFIRTAENIAIPIAVLMEFQMGIMLRCATDPVAAVQLSNWFNEMLSAGIPLIETDREVAEVWGVLCSDPRLRNLLMTDPRSKKSRFGQDIHIAAVSIAKRMPIATLNVKDFRLIDSFYPLPGIYHPGEDRWYARMEPLTNPEMSPMLC